jgi:hypothetical protein
LLEFRRRIRQFQRFDGEHERYDLEPHYCSDGKLELDDQRHDRKHHRKHDRKHQRQRWNHDWNDRNSISE